MATVLFRNVNVVPGNFKDGFEPYKEDFQALRRMYQGHVLVENSRIVLAKPGEYEGLLPDVVYDGKGAYLAPAIVEGQCNGFYNMDFSNHALSVDVLTERIPRIMEWGVGRLFPTVITGTHLHMVRCLENLNKAEEEDFRCRALMQGCRHVEGPFLGYAGAHPKEHLRNPDFEEYQEFRKCVGGTFLFTLDPTLPQALELVRIGYGWKERRTFAMSHTNPNVDPRVADYHLELLDAVKEAGCHLCIHLGNAYPDFPPESQYFRKYTFGYPGWAMAEDGLFVTVIADGYHLSPRVIKSIIRAKGLCQTILWTDMMVAAGMPPGTYNFAGQDIEVTDAAWLNRKEYKLAGSVLKPYQQIENVMNWCDLTLDEVWPMVSYNAAQALELDDLGSIQPWKEATLLFFKWQPFEVIGTMIEGSFLYKTQELEERRTK